MPSTDPPRGVAARAGTALWHLLADGVLPVLLPLWLLRAVAAPLLRDPVHNVAAPMLLNAGDANGEAWFYWWFHRALSTGAALKRPDVVCAPGGVALGGNFATRVDAVLAWPFFSRLPFPESFNTFAMAMPVLNAWCAWLGLRALRASPPVALLGGLVLGFSEYVIFEVGSGHNANALVGPAMLFLATWAAVARGSWGWSPVAAVAGCVTLFAYPPYALAVAPVALLRGVHALVTRPERRRAIVAGGGLVALAVGASAWTYLGQLEATGFVHHHARVLLDNWTTLVRDSLPWDWVARSAASFADHHVWVAPLLGVALLSTLAGGRPGLGWLATAAWFWVLSLGVVVLEQHGVAKSDLRIGGHSYRLPLATAITWMPTLVGVRPYRFAPLAVAAAVFGLAASLHHRVSARSLPWRFLASAAGGLLLAAALRQGWTAGRLTMTTQPWSVPAAIGWLAEQPGDFAIAELPVGGGHAYGPLQIVHGKRRSEGHHDVNPTVTEPPADCFTLDLTQALFRLDRAGEVGATAPGTDAAWAAGYRYVVVYKLAYDTRRPDQAERRRRVLTTLRAWLGPPVQDDGEVAVFALPPATGG
jgi:hypothetical protein